MITPERSISVILPIYECYDELPNILDVLAKDSGPTQILEIIAVAWDRRGILFLEAAQSDFPQLVIKQYETFPGLGRAKNDAIALSRSPFLLFLYPGLCPQPGAIELLVSALQSDPMLGAVAGRWRNAQGVIEKGYNVRRFPTPAALAFDALLINKLLPKNSATVLYKMHDFDHHSRIFVEHANDCAFMLRRSVLDSVGPFPEGYIPGWFDQIEFCARLKQQRWSVAYIPDAEFVANINPPLINRLVKNYYVEFYKSEYDYAKRTFSPISVALLRLAIILGMAQRLAFLYFPFPFRMLLLKRFRSYVSDAYIASLRDNYWGVLQLLCRTRG